MTLEQEIEALNTLCQQCELNIVNYSVTLYMTKNREHKADLKGWIKRDIENLLKWRQQRADKMNTESILKWQQERIPCSNILFVNEGGVA
jgi:hypothetical protein